MFDNIILGNTLKSWCFSLAIIVGALILNWFIVQIDRLILKKCSTNSKTRLDIIISTLEKPVLFGIMLAAIWFAATGLNMDPGLCQVIERAYKILIVLNITWAIAKFATILIGELQSKKQVDEKLLPFLKRGILIIVWIIGIVTALNNAGIEVATLLGALGVSGIAAALAAQDTIKNIFGGVTIFIDGHLHIGDTIQFDGFEGQIVDISLRSTRIKTPEDRVVTVPNFKLMDASVINVSTESRRRVLIKIGLTYDTAPQKMQEAIDILKTLPQSVKDIDSDTVAVFSDFGDSALILTYIYFIKKSADIREATSKINFEILTKFNNAGLNFAFPTQTVYLEKAD